MPSESDKWGWKHVSVFGGFDKGSGTKRWKCNHCNLRYNGSYSRVRAHLLGFPGVGVKSCPAIDRSLREAFQILEEERIARKKKRVSGTVNVKHGKRIRTSRPNLTCVTKEDVDDILARFFFADGLNTNIINSTYFHEMIKAVAAFGPSYEPPSMHELSVQFLRKEKERIEKSVALVRESWPHTGCTLLCVGRLDNMLGCFQVNIFVSSPRGLSFLKAMTVENVDAAGNSALSGILRNIVAEVGPTNVVQIVSHLGNANTYPECHLLSEFPHIFWSHCSSYSVHILMEEIAQLDWARPVILCAKEIEKCIISFQSFSSCVFTQNLKECSDSLFSKIAPSSFTIQKILELKHEFQEVFAREEWKQWKLSIPEDVGSVEGTILGDDFWNRAHMVLQICEPFIRLFASLNIDKCVMGDVHEWRVQAIDAVKSMGIGSGVLNQLEELIENRWDMLFSPLHSAAYILNPRYFGRGQTRDKIVMRGWKTTLERYECESAGRLVLREQLSSYWHLEGSLGEEDAVDCRDKMDPVSWWENFGFEIPQLQTLAIKVLSQVSSVVMCEEIWPDKGNPCQETASGLEAERRDDFLYVQNNLRLQANELMVMVHMISASVLKIEKLDQLCCVAVTNSFMCIFAATGEGDRAFVPTSI
ncbi:HAT, C-terminal dimerization domain containing protein [Senna tora]|uniref:HAT, C-terminal dimerization domain containing protein n=1 Tax=Senna tora TaxID=362788 RepID=A0A834TJK0_9FABA|nr:HAT, C-terminal dimerization domain containing protein [Senna tora]